MGSLKTRTLSITLGIDVGAESPSLPRLAGVQKDGDFYQSLGKHWAARSVLVSEETLTRLHANKQTVVESLKKSVASAAFVNFNYVGHGVLTPEGEWAMILPGMPPDLMRACGADFKSVPSLKNVLADSAKPKAKQFSPACAGVEDYLVRSSDLKRAFAGKKIFGFNDSCHAGGLDLGSESLMIDSSRTQQVAQDQSGLRNYLEKLTSKTSHSNVKSFKNLADLFPDSRPSLARSGLASATKRCLSGAVVTRVPGGQDCPLPIEATRGQALEMPVKTGGRGEPWSSCFEFGPVARSRSPETSMQTPFGNNFNP